MPIIIGPTFNPRRVIKQFKGTAPAVYGVYGLF